MWFWWALSSAIVSGISVTFNKRVLNRGVHSSIVSFALFSTLTIITLPLLLTYNSGHVDSTFYLAAAVSAFVFAISKNITLRIFKNNNLSDVYPLASIAPVTLYIMSVLFLSENIKPLGVFGIILMTIGVYILNYNYHDKNPLHPLLVFMKNKYSQLFMGAILLSNISAVTEKIALNHTSPGNVFYLAFWENFFLAIIIGGFVIKTNKAWVEEIRQNLKTLLVAGILYAILYLLVISGFNDGPISLVSAIKKLEVLSVLIISYIFFSERPTKKVYFATFIMLLAVLLIKL